MKIFFTVQGEGRGHLTQAMATAACLSRLGHELVGVVAGSNGVRELPEYFVHGFPVPVGSLPSPGFVLRGNRSIDPVATAGRALRQWGVYRRSVADLRARIEASGAGLVLNFFEPLTGLLQLTRPLRIPVVALAHQFLIQHPDRIRIRGRRLEDLGMRLFVSLVGYRSRRVALSFYPAPPVPSRRLTVAPPLLRTELFDLRPDDGGFLLVYLVNHGYSAEIRAWHAAHPGRRIHCFYDRPGAPAVEEVAPSLFFHRLDGTRFLEMMAGCGAVACTAGFESVCEAVWLGKPLLLVPVEGHFEQQVNAADALRCGLAEVATAFDLTLLASLPPPPSRVVEKFREWVGCAEAILADVIRRSDSAAPAPVRALRGATAR
jgi:uncharacterized protein (TIGR00661 family)